MRLVLVAGLVVTLPLASGDSILGTASGNGGMTFVTGGGQTEWRMGSTPQGGIARFDAIELKMTNASGAPLSGKTGRFGCAADAPLSCRLGPGGATSVKIKTNSSGIARLERFGDGIGVESWGSDGTVLVTAIRLNDLGLPVGMVATSLAVVASYILKRAVVTTADFRLTALDSPVSQLTIVSGNNQSKAAGGPASFPTTYFDPLKVQAKAYGGAALAGATVRFTCVQVSGITCQMPIQDPCTSSIMVDKVTADGGDATLSGGLGGRMGMTTDPTGIMDLG